MKVGTYEWHGKKVLVTGASGFKGSWLCAALHRLGAQVYGTVRPHRSPRSSYVLLGVSNLINEVFVDMADRQALYDMVNDIAPEVVFHLAAMALVPVSGRDPRRTFEVNIMGTANLIEACRRLQVAKRLLIVSTDHVFGNPKGAQLDEMLRERGFAESERVSYGGPYDTSKAAMELVVRCYYYTYWDELPTIGITRCANVFGIGDTQQRRVIPLFVETASTGSQTIPLRYRKNGRQFIPVTDALAGYIKAASSLDEGGVNDKDGKTRPADRSPFTPTFHFAEEDYNDVSGQPLSEPYITMKTLAEVVAALFPGTTVNETPDCQDYAPDENQVQALKCEHTRTTLNWAINKPFNRALQELGEWYQAEKNNDRHAMTALIDDNLTQLLTATGAS